MLIFKKGMRGGAIKSKGAQQTKGQARKWLGEVPLHFHLARTRHLL